MGYARIKPDIRRLNWITNSLFIIDKGGQFRLLRPNNGQLLLHSEIQQQRARGLPVRIVLLKPRQVGWSTWTEAEAFYDVYHNANFNAMAVSVDTDSTDVIFGMTKRYHSSLPRKLPTDNTNRKAIIFSEPHRSAFYAQTAGKVGVGRSFQARFLHNSEVAFWSDAHTQLAGLYQMVPKGEGTTIILESTANGMGGAFYDTFWEAVERVEKYHDYRGYRPVFFPWHKFAEYAIEPPKGYQPDHVERDVMDEFNLTLDQLYWRRLKIEELNGREEIFRQEYPATALEAFQTTGHPVFSTGIINYQKKHLIEPSEIKHGHFDPRTGTFEQNNRKQGWQVLCDGAGSNDYTIGIDTAEYKLSDQSDERSERDYDSVVVYQRNTRRVVAIWHSKGVAQIELGRQVLGAAKFFNGAWVCPEIPMAMGVLNVLINASYQHIYSRKTKTETYDPQDAELLGWRTTTTTRPYLINDLISWLRADAILLQFGDILNEMKTFIYDKTGKPIHMPGKHDDLIFALGLALQADLSCPKTISMSDIPSRTGEFGQDGEGRGPRTIADLAKVGAVDDIDDDFDEVEEAYWHTD